MNQMNNSKVMPAGQPQDANVAVMLEDLRRNTEALRFLTMLSEK